MHAIVIDREIYPHMFSPIIVLSSHMRVCVPVSIFFLSITSISLCVKVYDGEIVVGRLLFIITVSYFIHAGHLS